MLVGSMTHVSAGGGGAWSGGVDNLSVDNSHIHTCALTVSSTGVVWA